MTRSAIVAIAVLMCAAVLAAGCGSTEATEPRAGRDSTTAQDPRLAAAVDTIQTQAARGSKTFAGLVLNERNHTITVYRLPDPALDARIRAETPGVKTVFRDATYSLVQMNRFVRQITADREYWGTQGIHVNGAAPKPDGSGVLVFVADDPGAVHKRLSTRYPTMRLSLQKQTVVHPTWGGPLPAITVTGPLPSKS